MNNRDCENSEPSYEEQLEKFENALEKASMYTEIIISVGYIGFLTLLSWVKDSIDMEMRIKITLGFLFSLSFFIIWETIKMLSLELTKFRHYWGREIRKISSLVWIFFFCIIAISFGYSIVLLFCQLFQYLQT